MPHFPTGQVILLLPRRENILSRHLDLHFDQCAVQFNSVAQSCTTLCDPMDCSTPGFPVHHQLPELTQTHVHRVGDAIQPPHPLSSLSPAFNLSQHQGLFQWVSSLHQVTISPFNEYSGLISFRMDWFDLLAVQGILKSLWSINSSALSFLL